MEKENVWTRLKEILSNVSLKTYLYAIGIIAVLIAILMNVTGSSNYGKVAKDGKYYLNLEKIASDYGLDLNAQNTDGSSVGEDYVDNSDLNLTQDLSQSLFLTSQFLDQNGITDPTIKGQILANIVLDYQKQAEGKIYTTDNLNIIRGTDQNSIQEYYRDINKAIETYENNLKDTNITDISKLYNPEDTSNDQSVVTLKGAISANILKLVDVNNSFINDLISIPATTEGATYQLQLINTISQQNTYLKSLAYIDTDPMKYILADGDDFETKFNSDMSSIFKSFSDYFKTSGAKEE